MSAPAPAVSAPRECGDCTMCCRVMGITSLGKPPGVWCSHCTPGRGCGIYERRPQDCRDFMCGYLQMPELGERWKPSVCKFVISSDAARTHIKIVVDTARPDAWRREPYYSTIRQWAQLAPDEGRKLMVAIGKRAIILLPDREVDIGILEEDDRVLTLCEETPFGTRYDAVKLHKDDPRIRDSVG